ncbi:MAG: biosynthetic peptidoglycan transglycosylase [Mycobacteriaceae bacterium]
MTGWHPDRAATPGDRGRVHPPPRRRRRWVRRVLAALLGVVLFFLAGMGVLWAITPSAGDAEARIATRLAAHGATDPQALPVPNPVGVAVIATEDSRFRDNPGISPAGVARFALSPVIGDQGSATLEQQLAKVLYTPERQDFTARVEDATLALKLDAHYSKDQILEMYLAAVYFGHGFYGLPAAARGYFATAPADLSWAQASLLAGLVQAPSAYDPYAHLDLAKQRQRHVLDQLVATGSLSPSQADAAFAAPLGLTGR